MTTAEKVLEGLKILTQYPNSDICAEHDVIYAMPQEVSNEDLEKLKELGWRQYSDGFQIFV